MKSLFKVLHDRDRSILQSVIDRDLTLSKLLVDFGPLVGVLFADGWEVCPAFESFAKPENINLKNAALHFNANCTPFVPDRLLHQEADRRSALVDFLSSLAVLFHQAAS